MIGSLPHSHSVGWPMRRDCRRIELVFEDAAWFPDTACHSPRGITGREAHRKETFLLSDHPLYAEFARLSERTGLG
jgi:hypothetical protein